MQAGRSRGGVPAREYRRRRLLLLGGLILAVAVLVVALTRLNDAGTEPTDPGGGDPTAPAAAPEPPVDPPETEPPPTVEAPPTTTTTTEPPPTTTTTTTTEPSTTTTTEPPPTTTTTEPPPPTTTTTTEPPPPPPVALLTATGIPVTVLEVTETGYLVRTPCGNTAEIADGERIEPVRVVVDPGHGGPVETGTVGPNGVVERDLNLTLSEAVLELLAERGIAAAVTRTDDYMVRLGVRVEFADALEPEALVSIHHNGPTWDLVDTPGTEVYVQSVSPEEARPESARLGGLLYEEIIAALGTFEGIEWSALPDAGVKRVLLPDGTDTYTLVRGPETPSVLVEYGYLTNASEAELFATEEYIAVAAAATVDAIEAFLETDRPGSGFSTEPRTYDPPDLDVECTDPQLEPDDPTQAYDPTQAGDPDAGSAGEQPEGADTEPDDNGSEPTDRREDPPDGAVTDPDQPEAGS